MKTATRDQLDRYEAATNRTEVIDAVTAAWERLSAEGIQETDILDGTLGAVLAITTARSGPEQAARLCERAAARLRAGRN